MTFPAFVNAAAAVWADGSDVDKADIREWAAAVEAYLNALASGPALINGKLVVSVASNVLTVAVKTAAGNDPSAADPVYCLFREATAAAGGFAMLAIGSATSLSISAGATLGTSDGMASEILLTAFNDGGSFRLAAYNAYGGGLHYPLPLSGLASATAEGGDGSADSAGTFYAGVAVSAKAFRLLARLAWTTPLATAGLWSLAPDYVKPVLDLVEAVNISPSGLALMQGQRGADLFKILDSDGTGSNVNTAQPWFPTAGGVRLAAGRYFFWGLLRLSRAAGTTSHTTALLFGGTASLTAIHWRGKAKTGDANDLQGWSGFWSDAATALVLKAASTSATEQSMFEVMGSVLVGTAGTLIPQFQYSAAPGGAPSILAGSYFHLFPAGALTSAGTWS